MSSAAPLDYDQIARRGGNAALEQIGRFFMGVDDVHVALRKIASKLDALGIPYAVAGGMALNAHGYRRATIDVDILVTSEGLQRVHEALDGLGYVRPFSGSKNLKDTETTVRIEFLVAGQFPGDGKPKPVSFPDPAAVAVEIDGIKYLGLPALIELKLASGMTNELRAKDIGDVIALIQELRLPPEFGEQLNLYVREKFVDLAKKVAAERSSEMP
jgi:hypothetical protein